MKTGTRTRSPIIKTGSLTFLHLSIRRWDLNLFLAFIIIYLTSYIIKFVGNRLTHMCQYYIIAHFHIDLVMMRYVDINEDFNEIILLVKLRIVL